MIKRICYALVLVYIAATAHASDMDLAMPRPDVADPANIELMLNDAPVPDVALPDPEPQTLTFCALSQNCTWTGNNAWTGNDTESSLNNIISVDGVTYPFTNAGVNSAIAAACTQSFNQGGEVDLPPTTINVTNLASQLLLSPCPIHLKGVGGEATILSVAGGISSAIPIFRLKTTVSNLAYDLENIEFACLSSPTAGDVMLFDNGGGAGLGPSQVYIHHVIVDTGCFGGYDVNETTGGSFAGFVYHAEDNYFESGGLNSNLSLVDSQLWEHNLIRSTSTTNPCFNHTSLVGSATQTLIHNNLQCNYAGAIVHQANQIKMVLNQFEVTASCGDGSVIDFKGDVGAIDASEVLSNNINAHTFCTNNINFGANSTNWHVLGNKITMNPTAGCGINIVAGSTGGTIGPNTWGGGGTSTAVCGDTAAARVQIYANSGPGEPSARAIAPSDTDNAIDARANSGTQSAPLVRIENNAATELSYIDNVGNFVAANGTQAGCTNTGLGFLGSVNSGFNWFVASTLIQGCVSNTSVFALNTAALTLGSAKGFMWASTTNPISAGPDTGLARLSAGVVSADTSSTGNGLGSFSASGYLPHSAGGTDLGTTALPFGNLWLGTAATNNFKVAPAATTGARTWSIPDWGANAATTQNQPFIIALTSQYTNSTTTFSNVAGGNTVQFPVAANQNYTATCHLYYQSVALGGLNIEFTGPASPTAVAYGLADPTALGTTDNSVATAFGTSLGNVIVTAATNFDAIVSFSLINGANAGTVNLLAKASTAVQLQIQAGSFCLVQ
jgi:hypothetical protein